ncbi:MAG TPA: hypothetical protein VF316_01240, partial [Polyangiaceae bacterium]
MRTGLLALFLGTLLLSMQCGSDGEPVTGKPQDPPDVSGGGCDASKTPAAGGCPVTDDDGFFVSPTGVDTNPGTKAAPFKTVGAGINASKTSAKRNVYICAGTYDEQLLIDTAALGVALHGGFTCTDWSYSAAKTTVAPQKAGYVLKVSGSPAVVEDLELVAKDGDVPGASSIVAFVEAAPGLTFRRGRLVAGNGAAGKNGDPIAPYAVPATKGADVPGVGETPMTTCSCGSATTTGGRGGSSTQTAGAGTPTIAGAPTFAGQPFNLCGGNTQPGANPGADGKAATLARGASNIGALSSQGWTSAKGEDGIDGDVAQGGGGGTGNAAYHSSGGGCGGCGGKGAAGGTGGGASIALAVLNSTVRVQGSEVVTGNGGTGGNGGDAQQGQDGGGAGALFVGGLPGCYGAAGGRGGNGAGGGGGAGGSSIGILSVGAKSLDVDKAAKFTVGKIGSGGNGGGPASTHG